MVVVGFFDQVGPGCEFSNKGLSRIGVKGREFEFRELLDGFGVVDYL